MQSATLFYRIGRILLVSIVTAMILAPLTIVAWRHLGSCDLWFDESGQYWLARGQFHFAPPLTQDGGGAEIIKYGGSFNSDPGGYTVLLRYWIALFGSAPVALRSLSFVFLCATPLIIFLSAFRLGANALTALLAAAVPAGFPMLLHYGTEIRAYSMEACAMTFLFFLPCWLRPNSRLVVFLAAGFISALLADSRYSAFLPAAAACLVLAFPLRPFRLKIPRTLLYSIPILAMVFVSYVLFVRAQAGPAMRPPPYIADYLLAGKSRAIILAILQANLVTGLASAAVTYVLFASTIALCGPKPLEAARDFAGRTAIFTVLSITFILLASFAGKLPWAFNTRWSIGYQALCACCLSAAVIIAGQTLGHFARRTWLRILAAVAACTVAYFWTNQIVRALRVERPYYELIGSNLRTLAESKTAKETRFYVASGARPTVRYLCEVGPLRGAFDYPKNFHFETEVELNAASEIHARDIDIIVLQIPATHKEYEQRVRGGHANVHDNGKPPHVIYIKQ